ncbi:MAG: 16S rRNA (uracil(1498)-N(3))-methyltransferase [Cyanobacteria bacterium HKST-UBA03]|nr:16S rRNA (uracil(1498)-N(3))-methyltransferase [Cyanobacteria bacterium HKST-UBA03]
MKGPLVAGHDTLPWFYVDVEAVPLSGLLTLTDPDLLQHMTVMRLVPGDAVVLVSEAPDGPQLCQCQIRQLDRRQATVEVTAVLPVPEALPINLTLVCALIKQSHWDWVLQKLTELGVAKIVPLQARRSVVQAGRDAAKKHQRWCSIVRHAGQQSQQARRPELSDVLPDVQTFVESLAQAQTSPSNQWVAVARRQGTVQVAAVPLHQAVAQLPKAAALTVAVGPEGGWTDDEISAMVAGGFLPVWFGPSVMRSETAAVYVASVVHYAASQQALGGQTGHG